MKYILRNLIRLPKSSILLLVMALLVMLLSSFGIFVNKLCKESEERSFGPLYGYYSVTNADGEAILGYKPLNDIKKHSNAVEDVSVVSRYRCIIKDLAFCGTGRYETTELRTDPVTGIRAVYTGEFVHGFRLVGTTSTSECEEFYNGTVFIVKGSGITKSDNENGYFKAVISDELADLNGLDIGDSFSVNIWSLIAGYDYSRGAVDGFAVKAAYGATAVADDKYICFTVGGICHTYVDNTASCASPCDDSKNFVYVPISAVEYMQSLYEKTENNADILRDIAANARFSSDCDPAAFSGIAEAAYVKLSPDVDPNDFASAVNTIGFYDEIELTPFTSDSLELPSSKIFKIVSLFLYVVLITGFIMLDLILMYGITSRKREFNCLVAIGKSRSRVALSYFGEVTIVILAALIVSTVGFGVLVYSFGGTISEYLNNADSTVTFLNNTSANVLTPKTVEAIRTGKMFDFANLRDTYIIPTFIITAAATAAMLVVIFAVVFVVIKRINALRAMGEGKL